VYFQLSYLDIQRVEEVALMLQMIGLVAIARLEALE
jgi:hypothetical protein